MLRGYEGKLGFASLAVKFHLCDRLVHRMTTARDYSDPRIALRRSLAVSGVTAVRHVRARRRQPKGHVMLYKTAQARVKQSELSLRGRSGPSQPRPRPELFALWKQRRAATADRGPSWVGQSQQNARGGGGERHPIQQSSVTLTVGVQSWFDVEDKVRRYRQSLSTDDTCRRWRCVNQRPVYYEIRRQTG